MSDNYDEENNVTTYCDCNTVLRKFHGLLNEAEDLYKKSDNTIDLKVIEAINTAIANLEKAFELGGQGGEIEDNAYKMLDKSECSNTCNKNSTKCKELYTIAEEVFSLESEYLNHALNLLKDAQKDIQISIAVRKIGYKIRDQYKECVHCKKSTSD